MSYGYLTAEACRPSPSALEQLLALGIPRCRIYLDDSAAGRPGRPAYQKLVRQILRPGDLLVIETMGQLGQSFPEMIDEWTFIHRTVGAQIKVLDLPLADTRQHCAPEGDWVSDFVLQLLHFVAVFETDGARRRQAEGIAAAKARGVRFGRPPVEIPESFIQLHSAWRRGEISPREAIQRSGLTRSNFYKMVQRYEKRISQAGGQDPSR